MGVKGRSLSFDSPKTEVGEIDTRAPFASVRAAVSLFGATVSAEKSGRKAKPSTPSKVSTPEQKAFATETQLHLAQKELNKYKDQLQNAEMTQLQALAELEKAKKTVQELNAKLAVINESKELALKAAEAAKTQTNELKDGEHSSDSEKTGKAELDQSREQYAAITKDLDAAKQELRKIRKEFESSVEAKISAFSRESDAKQEAEMNASKAEELAKEIAGVKESLLQVKLAAEQAQQEESKFRAGKDTARKSYQLALEESEKKLATLRNDFNPELCKELEEKLAKTNAEINAVRKRLEDCRCSDLDSVNAVTNELGGVREVLQKVVGEESSLRSMVESLKLEMETVSKQHSELKMKDAETEALIAELHLKLQDCKHDLESAMAAESKTSFASVDLASALQQLQLESETALQETEMMKKEAEALRNEAESARSTLAETEKRLEVALKEAEEAKAAEARALEEVKGLSARTSAARSSTSADAGAAEITISKEEYESLSQKVQESEKLTEMKVAAAVAQVEAIKASEAEAAKKLQATQKEIEEVEAARGDAVKRAEMAEAAKKAVEGELKRWREKEQKTASEMAARLLAETEEGAAPVVMPAEPLSPVVNKTPSSAVEGDPRRPRNLFQKKSMSLLPNLGGIFHRKKSMVDAGSPSLGPGEKDKHV